MQEISDANSEYDSFETGRSENASSSKNVERDKESEEEYSSENFENDNQSDSSDSQIENFQVSVRKKLRDRRTLKAPARYGDYVTLMIKEIESAVIGEVSNISVAEALKDENWKNAMKDKYKSLIEMKTWISTEKPKDVTPLTCRWVLCEKKNGKYKARLVVRGFEQKEGRDYFQVFIHIARHMFICLILSIAASESIKIMTFDIKSALLHGD